MGRALLASAALHVLAASLAFLLGGVAASSRSAMPPVYQVQLVSAAELAPQRTRPEPRPAEPVEEETPSEPDTAERVPDPERTAPERAPAADQPTPRPGPERGPRAGPDLPFSLEGRPFPYPWYLEEIYRKVLRNWRPPSNTLETTVHFRIEKNGRISEVGVEESSGNFLFDQAALRAVEASNPMPPLPREYGGDWLGVYFDFTTELRPRS